MRPIARARRLSSRTASSRHALDAVAVANSVPVGIPAYFLADQLLRRRSVVPLKGPLPETAPKMITIIPNGATASVTPTSSCRLTNFHEYQPEYVTVCGQP
jgi:hypothetical protein